MTNAFSDIAGKPYEGDFHDTNCRCRAGKPLSLRHGHLYLQLVEMDTAGVDKGKPGRPRSCARSRRVWDKAGRKPTADVPEAMSSCTAHCARSRSR